MSEVTCTCPGVFTASGQLRRVAAFGGTWSGNRHDGLLQVTPSMTWDDVFFKQADGSALLGFLIYDNLRDNIHLLISTDQEREADTEVTLRSMEV